ncbi:nitroreductase family protein [Prevotella sp. kh1p2]|uniref:nitroreductase family protein n=1 Tax=Prevotella sp. kh1p2 TaxID=1761883 RepID=UPI0008C9BF2A|nr:nitroreductase family protein [Prevotella sp. kh1p2]SET17894.1 Nitroreductase [Prevotella sp. kh1p2]SNU12019.1 Nitroreductase [Prevotellaceae bacterium KH2P17]
MNMIELIRTRKSVRTFDGRPLSEEDVKKLSDYAATITNPYGISVSFVFLDAKEHGLSSPVINGEHLYVAGKVPMVAHCEEAFGYSFEQFVLYAWSLGIGTTWIRGTMKRELFEQAAETADGELMPTVTSLGYPATERAEADIKLRATVHGDERLEPSELFFDKTFSTPLSASDYDDALDAVRWAPSAANRQPCRVVKDGNAYHFYLKHSSANRSSATWDVQKIDLGISICHFMNVTGGEFSIADPKIGTDESTEYIATVTIKNK